MDGLPASPRLPECHQGDPACAPPRLSLVIPAFNEQETIVQAIAEAEIALKRLGCTYEILVVDDGSRDATRALAEEQAAQRDSVAVLRQPQNMGYGAALRRGFAAARGASAAFTDADCQFDLAELDRLLMLAGDYDIVCGYRIKRQDPWLRSLYSGTYNLLCRTLLGTRVRDCDCALKVFRRDVIQSIESESKGFFFNAEVLSQAALDGRSIVEVGVTHRPRAAGESTVSLRHAIPVATSLLRFWWNKILFPGKSAHRVEERSEQADPVHKPVLGHSLLSGCETTQPRAPLTLRTPRSLNLKERKARAWGGMLALFLVAFALLFSRLAYPLFEPDETRYAQIGYEMAQSSDWVTPTLDGEPYLDKPPLLYWSIAASYKLLGATDLAARLPGALSALLCITAVATLGSSLVGRRAALCGGAALLLCCGFVISGRFVLMDGPLTLFTTLATLTSYLACRGMRVHWGWWLATSAACGLGVLTKGPVMGVLFLPPLLAWRWLSAAGCPIRWRHWGALVAVVMLLTLPWFLAVSIANPDFLAYFFWKHHLVRFVNAFNHEEPWWYYLPTLCVGMFPSSLMFPALGFFLLGRRPELRSRRTAELGWLALAAVWPVVFFSLSTCKLPTYILPSLPPLSLLLGALLDKCALGPCASVAAGRELRKVPKAALCLAAACCLVVAAVHLAMRSHSVVGWGAHETLVIAAAGAIAFALFKMVDRASQRARLPIASAVALAMMAIVFNGLIPELSQMRSIHAQAADLRHKHDDAPIVYFGRQAHTAALRLGRHEYVQIDAEQLDEVQHFLQSHAQAILVTSPEAAEAIGSHADSTIELTPAGGRGQLFVSRWRGPGTEVGRGAAALRR